jgi:hypothetical protein
MEARMWRIRDRYIPLLKIITIETVREDTRGEDRGEGRWLMGEQRSEQREEHGSAGKGSESRGGST